MADAIVAPALEVGEAVVDSGPRKLVRPRLAEQSQGKRQQQGWRQKAPLRAHHELASTTSAQLGSQAELFYFQKQMQAQTAMVFVLEDGERIEGIIEWYDQHVIKVRHTTRTLIYKSSIKYLYKASEAELR